MDDPRREDLGRAWPAVEPPEGFAERVMAARAGERAAEVRGVAARRGLRHAILAVLVASSVAGVFLFTRGAAPRSQPARGALQTAARQEVRLDRRGLAVAEPGAKLSWTVEADGQATVTQTAGDVFYRVEKGGPFRVITPEGEVVVQGTCFRVEVMMSPNLKMMVAGATGAALAATLVVSVYEGKVLVRSSRGDAQATATAGEQIGVVNGKPTRAAVVGRPGPGSQTRVVVVGAASEAPAADVTREQLLERDRQQRAAIAALTDKLQQLEGAKVAIAGGPERRNPRDEKMFDLSQADWADMAKRCEIRFGLPPMGQERGGIPARQASALGLDDEDRKAVEGVLQHVSDSYLKALREIYVETTGDTASAETLAANAMAIEILQKSADDDGARRKVALERAGQLAAPADPNAGSAAERYYRLVLAIGDQLSAELGKLVGPDRAATLRDQLSGMRSIASGCKGQDDEDVTAPR